MEFSFLYAIPRTEVLDSFFLGLTRVHPIIKLPFMRMTLEWPNATYACVNYGEAFAPVEIQDRSICIDDDIGAVLDALA